VLFYLIGNALKFTEEGRVRLSAGYENLSDDGSLLDLLIAVEDTGIGIPAEDQESVFESFRQQSSQIAKKYGGTGLGLTISRKLAEMMDGSISLDSRVGQGSTFSIRLRNVRAAVESSLKKEVSEPVIDRIRFRGEKVLLVDDVESNRLFLREVLTRANLIVLEAADGTEAVILAAEALPDFIFMDIRMPLMNGLEATRQIRKLPLLNRVPIVALTASTDQTAQQQIQLNGFDGFLTKPVNLSRLFHELCRHLRFQELQVEGDTGAASLSEIPVTWLQNPSLMATLRQEIVSLVEHQQGTLSISAVHRTAERLEQLGRQHGWQALQQWGSRLKTQADRFDVDQISRILAELSQIQPFLPPVV